MFNGIAGFFKNLFKDPLKTVFMVLAIIGALFTFGATAFIAFGVDISYGMIIAALEVISVGCDLKWLQVALSVFMTVCSIYSIWSWDMASLAEMSETMSLNLSNETLAALCSWEWRMIFTAANVFLSYTTLVSARDDSLMIDAAGTAAYEVAHFVGNIASGAIDGLTDGVFGGALGSKLLLLGALALGGYLLLRSTGGDDATIRLEPNPA